MLYRNKEPSDQFDFRIQARCGIKQMNAHLLTEEFKQRCGIIQDCLVSLF